MAFVGRAPLVADSTREERLAWVQAKYPCISDCEACGVCKMFHGRDAVHAFAPYIDGQAEMREVARSLR